MHMGPMLMPWHEIQCFAIANLALEARQHILSPCNAAYVLSTGSRRVLAALPLCFPLLLPLSVSESHREKNKAQKKKNQIYCIVPPPNYKAVHAQPSSNSDKNNSKIEHRNTHLENMVRQRGVN